MFELAVPFTTPDLARASLRSAAVLAAGIPVCVKLIAEQVIQWPSPLEPDSRTSHLNAQLVRVACDSHIEVSPFVVLTREKDQAYAHVVPPSGIVLITAGKRWFGPERRLARRLRHAGYTVLLCARPCDNYLHLRPRTIQNSSGRLGQDLTISFIFNGIERLKAKCKIG